MMVVQTICDKNHILSWGVGAIILRGGLSTA
jgi:hypothetical protein